MIYVNINFLTSFSRQFYKFFKFYLILWNKCGISLKELSTCYFFNFLVNVSMLFIEIKWVKAVQVTNENILLKLLPLMLDTVTDKRLHYNTGI